MVIYAVEIDSTKYNNVSQYFAAGLRIDRTLEDSLRSLASSKSGALVQRWYACLHSQRRRAMIRPGINGNDTLKRITVILEILPKKAVRSAAGSSRSAYQDAAGLYIFIKMRH